MSEVLDQDPAAPDRDVRLTTGAPPALCREVVLPAPDRSRVAAVAAMCSLAGIAVGFGLSMFALQMTEAATSAARLRAPRHAYSHCPRRVVPRLGIEFGDAHASIGIHGDIGVLISQIFATPARNAGLRPGDVVVRYNGEIVDNMADMVQLVAGDRVGGRPILQVARDGELLRVVPTLDAWP